MMQRQLKSSYFGAGPTFLPSDDETAYSSKSSLQMVLLKTSGITVEAVVINQWLDGYKVLASEDTYIAEQMDRKAPEQGLRKESYEE
ncbi:MAG: hypothetical protein M1820_010877 [Bogoriella megaspora]|nr:MAG: hypothetical protein M1820_010877 [Bogoriella megaspora]